MSKLKAIELFILFNEIKMIDIASSMYANITIVIESVQLIDIASTMYANITRVSSINEASLLEICRQKLILDSQLKR